MTIDEFLANLTNLVPEVEVRLTKFADSNLVLMMGPKGTKSFIDTPITCYGRMRHASPWLCTAFRRAAEMFELAESDAETIDNAAWGFPGHDASIRARLEEILAPAMVNTADTPYLMSNISTAA